MNPPDEGNFELPMPFLDRFALALPITMPDYLSMQTIGKKDKVNNKASFNFRLSGKDLDSIQEYIQIQLNMSLKPRSLLTLLLLITSYVIGYLKKQAKI